MENDVFEFTADVITDIGWFLPDLEEAEAAPGAEPIDETLAEDVAFVADVFFADAIPDTAPPAAGILLYTGYTAEEDPGTAAMLASIGGDWHAFMGGG